MNWLGSVAPLSSVVDHSVNSGLVSATVTITSTIVRGATRWRGRGHRRRQLRDALEPAERQERPRVPGEQTHPGEVSGEDLGHRIERCAEAGVRDRRHDHAELTEQRRRCDHSGDLGIGADAHEVEHGDEDERRHRARHHHADN